MEEKITIGRKDKGDFPEFKLRNIDLKVDTGAYTSAIHCHEITQREENGRQVLSFTLLDPSHQQYGDHQYATSKFRQKSIKSSNGSSETRFVIETDIKLFGEVHPIELSLSERGEMKFPILIGRKFLMGKFIVDPSRYNLSYRRKQKLLKEKKL